jgi:hypothetical protein
MSEQHNNTRLQDLQACPSLKQTDSESERKRKRERGQAGELF